MVSEQEKLIDALHLPHHIWHYVIPQDSRIDRQNDRAIGCMGKIQSEYSRHIPEAETWNMRPGEKRNSRPGRRLALLGNEENVEKFASAYNLNLQEQD